MFEKKSSLAPWAAGKVIFARNDDDDNIPEAKDLVHNTRCHFWYEETDLDTIGL